MTPDELIRSLVRQAEQVSTCTDAVGRRAAQSLLRDLKAADADLSARLTRISVRNAFGARQVAAYRAQIRAVIATVEPRLLGVTQRTAQAAADFGSRSAVAELERIESAFRGAVTPLPLKLAIRASRVGERVGASLLSRHESSVARYGQAMVQNFERHLRVGLLAGDTPSQMVDRLAGEGFSARRGWAWRIVRTETSYAMNASKLDALRVLRDGGEEVQKKILATFDNRTAMDSKAVHGQIRPIDGLFVDGLGRRYLAPPARPNDREVVVPWRSGWPDRGYTRPL